MAMMILDEKTSVGVREKLFYESSLSLYELSTNLCVSTFSSRGLSLSSFADLCVSFQISSLIFTTCHRYFTLERGRTVDKLQASSRVDVVELFRVWVDGHACMMNERGLLHAAALLDGRGVVSLSCS